MSSVAIVGAGAWGRALAIQAARAGRQVKLWGRSPVGRVSPRLPGVRLPDAVQASVLLPEREDAILMAVPMQHLRAVLAEMRPRAPLLICCKGAETGSGALPLEIAARIHPGMKLGFLTGPNFASEIAAGRPAASVIAADTPELRTALVELLASANFRLYGSADPVGAQIGAAAKNVIAIAAGAVIGAGLGENARAALVTRGLAEISRLIAAQGGAAETASGLSGMGDLVLTCTGTGSRNFSYGLALGRGETPHVAGVVEGVATASALVARAGGIDLPICQAVDDLLAGRISLEGAIARLLSRKLREEGVGAGA